MVLLLDNYDSFSYNLLHLASAFCPDIRIARSDCITLDKINLMAPSHLIISSGPGRPGNTGICEQAINTLKDRLPILGVGLGHQVICFTLGGALEAVPRPAHGRQSCIHIANGSAIFKGLPPIISAACYHSRSIAKKSLADELLLIAENAAGEVMAVKHRDHDLYGLQFQPESILTPQGRMIMANFLSIGGCKK